MNTTRGSLSVTSTGGLLECVLSRVSPQFQVDLIQSLTLDLTLTNNPLYLILDPYFLTPHLFEDRTTDEPKG